MFLFDLHCDTIGRLHDNICLKPGEGSFLSEGVFLTEGSLPKTDTLLHNHGHLALDRMAGIDWCQCFAVFMPDQYRGPDAVAYFESCYRYFQTQLAQNAGRLAQVQTVGQLKSALSDGKAAAMLTVEGGSALGGDLSRVGRLAECGVRIVTLTWNGENELASGNATSYGFSGFGREAVAEFERAGIVADVSHLNDRGFEELAGFARRPFIATHSDARSVHTHPRNLTDDQFRYIVSIGGLVGLNFCVHFLSDDPDPAFPRLAAHLERFLRLGGEDVVALGSDFDGCDVPSWLGSGEKFPDLYREVCGGFGQGIADKLFFTNAADFFARWEGGM